jgi:hypothetical protein
LERLHDGLGIDIHEALAALAFSCLAGLASLTPEQLTLLQGPRQKSRLPGRMAAGASPLLIDEIVGAQAVAMHQEDWLAVHQDKRRVVEQSCPALMHKVLAQEKVAIAPHHPDANVATTEPLQDLGQGSRGGVGPIVTHPHFEEIAEQEQVVTLCAVFLQGLQDPLRSVGLLVRQMKV